MTFAVFASNDSALGRTGVAGMLAREAAIGAASSRAKRFALLTFPALRSRYANSQGVIQVTDSSSTLLAILFGLGVFAIIVAIGWRSVQNRRILRLKGANGQETIIVAGEDDDISSVVTTVETTETTRSN